MFEVIGPPRPKARPRVFVGNDGKSRAVTPKATKQYENAVKGCARFALARWRRDGLYRVTLRFVFDGRRRGDLDNYAKAVLDGLQGAAFENDRQVSELVVREAVEAGNARTVVLVERLGDAPARKGA